MYILNINWFKLKYNYNDDRDNVCDATITDHDQELSSYSLLPTNEDRQAIITYLLFLGGDAYPITAHAILLPACPVIKLSGCPPCPQSSSSA